MRALLLCPLIGGRWRHHHKVRPAADRFGVHSAPLAQPVVQDLAFCIRRRPRAIRGSAVKKRLSQFVIEEASRRTTIVLRLAVEAFTEMTLSSSSPSLASSWLTFRALRTHSQDASSLPPSSPPDTSRPAHHKSVWTVIGSLEGSLEAVALPAPDGESSSECVVLSRVSPRKGP